MKSGFVFLDECGLIWERVVFIPKDTPKGMPKGYIYGNDLLFESEWNKIDSIVKGWLWAI